MTFELAPDERRLCQLEEIPDGKARGFPLGGRSDDIVFAIRHGDKVFIYDNVCPHSSSPLAWTKDGYLSADHKEIICYLHGARFTIEDGVCTDGPCVGDKLTPVATRIVDGAVIISTKGLL